MDDDNDDDMLGVCNYHHKNPTVFEITAHVVTLLS